MGRFGRMTLCQLIDTRRAAIVVAVLAAVCMPTMADVPTAPTDRTPGVIERNRDRAGGSQAGLSDGAGLISYFGPLCVVLVVVGGLAWVAKRWMPQSLRNTGSGVLRIVARQSLSAKQSLCVVRFGRRVVLVGVTPERFTALSEVNDSHESAAIIAAAESGSPHSFSAMFTQASDEDANVASAAEAAGFDDGTESVAMEADSIIPSRDLARSRAKVKQLLERVRSLSTGITTSAEPAQRSASR